MQPHFLLMIDLENSNHQIMRTNADLMKGKLGYHNGRKYILIVAPHSFVLTFIHNYIKKHSLKPKEIVFLWNQLIFKAIKLWNST